MAVGVTSVFDKECHVFLRTALELGRWSTGEPMSSQEKAEVLQLLIRYESKYLPKKMRIGYMPNNDVCNSKKKKSTEETILRFKA